VATRRQNYFSSLVIHAESQAKSPLKMGNCGVGVGVGDGGGDAWSSEGEN
jgi:hypothetical protein